jgi:hypothetical protein
MSAVSAPENRFSTAAGAAYDPSVVTEMLTWRQVHVLVARELGEPVYDARPLTPPRTSRMTWAALAQTIGAIVVKARYGDRANEKTQWCASHLPALEARGYPVPTILWHGMVSAQWHVTVLNRLPGRPLDALDGPMLDTALRLVELTDCAAWSATGRSRRSLIPPASGRRTAIHSEMRSARRSLPSSTGFRRPPAHEMGDRAREQPYDHRYEYRVRSDTAHRPAR